MYSQIECQGGSACCERCRVNITQPPLATGTGTAIHCPYQWPSALTEAQPLSAAPTIAHHVQDCHPEADPTGKLWLEGQEGCKSAMKRLLQPARLLGRKARPGSPRWLPWKAVAAAFNSREAAQCPGVAWRGLLWVGGGRHRRGVFPPPTSLSTLCLLHPPKGP